MLICTKCGHEADEGETFCGRCGAFLEWTGSPAAPAEAPPPVPPAAPARRPAEAPEPPGAPLLATVAPRALRVEAGAAATVAVEIANRGRTVDQVGVAVLGAAAAWAAAEPTVLNLMPGATGTATVTFRPPRSPGVTAGVHDVDLEVRSSQHPAASLVERAVVEVGAFTALEATLTPSVLHGSGATASLLHLVNGGNARAELSFAADDPEAALTFGVNPPALILEPGGANDALVVVKPREPLAAGPDRTRPFRVVVSAADGTRRAVAATFVQAPVPAPPPPPAPEPTGPPLVVTPSTNLVRVEPGGQAAVTLDVRNRRPAPDRAALELRGAAAAWASVEPARLDLGPEAAGRATVSLRPPRAPATQPGRYPLEIGVRSAEHAGEPPVERVDVDVPPFVALESVLAPSVLRGAREATARIRVTNQGNAPVGLALAGDDPELALELRFSPAKLALKPGAAGEASVTVRARRENRTRADLARPFRVVLASGDEARFASDGTFVQEAPRARRRWPATLVVLALLVAAVAIVGLDPGLVDLGGLFGGPGATSEPTPTEAPSVGIITPEPLPVTCAATEPDDWLTLSAGQPEVLADRPLCLLQVILVASGTGSGPVRVLAGGAEVLAFDLAAYDTVGVEGAGSGERLVVLSPVAVGAGLPISLELGGCSGDGCSTLLVQLAVAGGS